MSYRNCIAVLSLAAAFLIGPRAQAALIVDQRQEVVSNNITVFGTAVLFVPWSVAQSFAPSGSNIAGADIFVPNNGFAGNRNIRFGIFDNRPDLGGNLLAEQIVPFVQTNATTGNVTVEARWSPVDVIAGATYYLALGGAQTLGVVVGTGGNLYSSGDLFGTNSTVTGALFLQPGRDLAFRTYTETATGAIPEPGTAMLLLLGLAPLAIRLAARRRLPGR